MIGSTNLGKSTTVNVLSKSDIFAENKLFATLDTTVNQLGCKKPSICINPIKMKKSLSQLLINTILVISGIIDKVLMRNNVKDDPQYKTGQVSFSCDNYIPFARSL